MSTVSQPSATVEQALEAYPIASSTGLPQTWERCMHAYLASLYNARARPRTIQTHRKILIAFFASLADAGRSPGQANPQDFTSFERRSLDEAKSLISGNEIRACLRDFYHFAGSFLPDGELTPDALTASTEPRAKQDTSSLPPPSEKRNLLPAIDISNNPWMECIAHFVRHILNKSQSQLSAESYYLILMRFLRLHPDPAAVVRRDVENFMNQPLEKGPRQGDPPKVRTRNMRLAIISSFFKFALSFIPTGQSEPIYQKHNPASGIYYGKPERLHRSLNEEELARLFAVIPDTVQGYRDRAYFLCLLLTARRREELLRLKWGDITQSLIIDEHGKAHQGYLYSYRSKGNGLQVFKAELPGLAYRAIEKFLVVSGRKDTIQPDDPIFIPIGPKGGGGCARYNIPVGGQTMNCNLKHYAALAGLDPRRQIVIHSFRHTAIQQRLIAGQQPIEIMRISGHKSMDSFYKYCLRLTGEADPGASAIEQKFGFLAE